MSPIPSPSNLDRLAAKYAQKVIARTCQAKKADVDNVVTKALGVLQENGVYACFLYLLAKEGEKGGVVVDEMLNLLAQLGYGWQKPVSASAQVILEFLTDNVTVNLEPAILAKETLEQMLIYARYGAKARSS